MNWGNVFLEKVFISPPVESGDVPTMERTGLHLGPSDSPVSPVRHEESQFVFALELLIVLPVSTRNSSRTYQFIFAM